MHETTVGDVRVGTGLEKVLTNAKAKQILDTELSPHFKKEDFDGGLSAGVTAIIAATKGAYQGNGLTVSESLNATTNAPAP